MSKKDEEIRRSKMVNKNEDGEKVREINVKENEKWSRSMKWKSDGFR